MGNKIKGNEASQARKKTHHKTQQLLMIRKERTICEYIYREMPMATFRDFPPPCWFTWLNQNACFYGNVNKN